MVGDALPVRDLLKSLHQEGKLQRYVAVDFSKDMEIAKTIFTHCLVGCQCKCSAQYQCQYGLQ